MPQLVFMIQCFMPQFVFVVYGFQTGQLCVRVAAKRPIKMEVSSWEIIGPTGQALFVYRRVVYMFLRENHTCYESQGDNHSRLPVNEII